MTILISIKQSEHLKQKLKSPEISDAMNIAGKDVRAFDICNTVDNSTKLQKADMLKGLVQLYGNEQHSNFKNKENVASPLFTFSGDVDSSINYFLADLKLCLTLSKKELNKKISIMIKEKKLMSNVIDSYRHDHSILLSDVYSRMYVNSEQYPEIMKL